RVVVTLALASGSTVETAAPPPVATIVFRGGPILTVTDSGTVAALAVRDGTIVAVGTEEEDDRGHRRRGRRLDGRAAREGEGDDDQ
ncbi:MAG TPA: hypothetical protein VK845_13735, partial [Gemmatimonadales bacterium]|nr:hypothetical protein [Gemmatimonadales bacterium]